MSWKISSSFARLTAGASATGSPMNCWTRVVAAFSISTLRVDRSVRQTLVFVLHDAFDEICAADDAAAFGNQVRLGHVEQIEVGRAAIELRAGLVGILDEIEHGFWGPRLHEQLFGDALLHEAPGGRR